MVIKEECLRDLSTPVGIGFDENGDILALDTTDNQLWRLDSSTHNSTSGVYGKNSRCYFRWITSYSELPSLLIAT